MILEAVCVISYPSVNSNWSYCPETLKSEQNFSVRMTLKFDWWPRNQYSFVYHFIAIGDIQIGVIVRKGHFGSNLPIFFVQCEVKSWRRTLKINGASLLCHFKFVHHFVAICTFKLELPEMPKLGQNLFWPLWPWLVFSGRNLLHGHHFYQWQLLLKISWWYDERNIVKIVWGQTDRRADGQTDAQHRSLSGVPDFFDRNKILSGGDLFHYQVPHCIRVFSYFVWFVFIHHNFQFYFELCTCCNILDIYLS